jgi:hypothetical protein
MVKPNLHYLENINTIFLVFGIAIILGNTGITPLVLHAIIIARTLSSLFGHYTSQDAVIALE